jgi:hypothetical protein
MPVAGVQRSSSGRTFLHGGDPGQACKRRSDTTDAAGMEMDTG